MNLFMHHALILKAMKNNLYSQSLVVPIGIYLTDGLQDVCSCHAMRSFYIFMCSINNI